MIRMSRACIFGKFSWNIPVVAQRVVPHPNQLQKLVEFSVFADKNEKTLISDLKEKIVEKEPVPSSFQESYHEIRNTFLRDMLNGGFRKTSSPNFEALKTFFDTLPSFPPPGIIEILKLLAETRNRPIESIRNLCLLLCTHPNWDYTPKDCSDLLFSLAKLSYRDDQLINIIIKKLNSMEVPIMDNLASKILLSLGELKCRDPELIGKLTEVILCPPISLHYSISCLKAVSILNYSCPKVEKLIQLLSEFKEVDFVKSQHYMDFIWTCMILDKASLIPLEHISRVLSLSFVSRILTHDLRSYTQHKWVNILLINCLTKSSKPKGQKDPSTFMQDESGNTFM